MSVLHAARQFLLDPRAFFEERGTAGTLPGAAVAVVVLAVVLGVAVALVGGILAGAVDGTVTVDNPDRPSDSICEMFGDDPDASMSERCDEPKTIERDAGSIVREATEQFYIPMLVAPFLFWLAGAVTLYLGGLGVGGDTSLAGSFGVAGWAAVPELVRVVVGLAAVDYAMADVTVSNLESAPAAVGTALAPVDPYLAAVTVLTAAWQLHILSAGLAVEADVDRLAAAVVTGIPIGLLVFASLV